MIEIDHRSWDELTHAVKLELIAKVRESIQPPKPEPKPKTLLEFRKYESYKLSDTGGFTWSQRPIRGAPGHKNGSLHVMPVEALREKWWRRPSEASLAKKENTHLVSK